MLTINHRDRGHCPSAPGLDCQLQNYGNSQISTFPEANLTGDLIYQQALSRCLLFPLWSAQGRENNRNLKGSWQRQGKPNQVAQLRTAAQTGELTQHSMQARNTQGAFWKRNYD